MAFRSTILKFWLLVLAVALEGCAAGIQVAQLGGQSYQPTKSVAVLTVKPVRPFIVIGRFSGYLLNTCPADDPYCDVRKRAMAMGGDAIWIQHKEVTHYPDQWIMVQGKLTHIYASQSTHVEGVVIRYKRSGASGSPGRSGDD